MLMNLTEGGLFGYCSSKCITSRKVPSSKAVSAGPIITAFLMNPEVSSQVSTQLLNASGGSHQVMTLSATGDADTPAGGSVCMRWETC